MFYGVIERETLLSQEFSTVLILSTGTFNDRVTKSYSSFLKMIILPFSENMDKFFLKLYIDQI